jgi:ankyrin repeat protein
MNLLSLSNELMLEIAKHLQNQAWLNTFARTNRFIFSVVNPYIYRYNADYHQHTALAFGVCGGLENVVRRSLGAKPSDINAKIGSIIPVCGEWFHTPLCYAVVHGQMRVIELLLDEYGADIEQHCCTSVTLLIWVVHMGMLELTKLLVGKVRISMRRTELEPDQFIMLLGRVMWRVWRFLSKEALMFIKPHLVKPQVKYGPAFI